MSTYANRFELKCQLKGLFHPACLARVVSWFAFVVAIFLGHGNGDKQRPTKRRHVQGMLDETDPLKQLMLLYYKFCPSARLFSSSVPQIICLYFAVT